MTPAAMAKPASRRARPCKTKGVLRRSEVLDGSPAAKAGLKQGDILVKSSTTTLLRSNVAGFRNYLATSELDQPSGDTLDALLSTAASSPDLPEDTTGLGPGENGARHQAEDAVQPGA